MALIGRMDAGELREYIVNKYGNVLLYGGTGEKYWRMYRLIRKLSKLSKIPMEKIIRHLKADAATLSNPKRKVIGKIKTSGSVARMKADHKNIVKASRYALKAADALTKANIKNDAWTLFTIGNKYDKIATKSKAHIKMMRKRAKG